ncbi:unnamed protein product [Moneuplotes crassus]|uniref:PHR domain-containing protein n=1 Tax=Euplotes crassus TaxID=5936 RepID=A0AAD1XHF7_EUPCR|nr:unnamed protein product [Moneuplotes crassus]
MESSNFSKQLLKQETHIWKYTFDDKHLPFTSEISSFKEKTQEELRGDSKGAILNLSESDVFRTLKEANSPVFNVDKLVYNVVKDKWFRVLDLKIDEHSNPTWVCLVERDGVETIELSTQEEFDQYESSLKLLVSINFPSGATTILEVNLKIYEKLEIALKFPFEGIGASISFYKLFFDGKEIDMKACIASIEGIHRGDTLLASEGLGKPCKFSRFSEEFYKSEWDMNLNYHDAIIFIPQKDIKFCGFTSFAASDTTEYPFRYQINIDGVIVEKEEKIATDFEDKYYCRHRLNSLYPVKAGQKIEIIGWTAKDFSNLSDYIYIYFGSQGEKYKEIQNEHMGLFVIETKDERGNWTNVSEGNFPEILYYL